jgi:hypothetical protein
LALLGVIAASLAVGCSPKIGDKCSVSTDCSVQGDRLCDPTQPGGYCTVFNCEPDKCPDESVCVAFNETTCSSPAISRRFQRTFCLAGCSSNDDCRAGYQCLDGNDPTRQIVDQNPSSRTICAVPASGMTTPPAHDPGVCLAGDAGLVSDAAVESAAPESATPDSEAEAPSPEAAAE